VDDRSPVLESFLETVREVAGALAAGA
jgi:hypothetical protein